MAAFCHAVAGIIFVISYKKMSRVAAFRVVAVMAPLHARDIKSLRHKNYTMRVFNFSLRPTNPHFPIPRLILSPLPFPTTVHVNNTGKHAVKSGLPLRKNFNSNWDTWFGAHAAAPAAFACRCVRACFKSVTLSMGSSSTAP